MVLKLLCLAVFCGSLILVFFVHPALRRATQRISFLVRGPHILLNGYEVSNGKPFSVSTPSHDLVVISDERSLSELDNAPRHQLSISAVAKDLLQPKYTIRLFEWNEKRGVEGLGFVRALRTLLTTNLPALLPGLQQSVRMAIEEEFLNGQTTSPGERTINLFPAIKRIVGRTNCIMFFGDEIAKNSTFVKAAIQFPQDVIFAAELVRMVPAFAADTVARLVTRNNQALQTMTDHLYPLIDERMRSSPGSQQEKPNDCVQWLLDTSPQKQPWSSQRMVGEILAVWFGSVHQLSMTATYAIMGLCDNPEWANILADRFQNQPTTEFKPFFEDPLLDAFISETARVYPSDAMSCRRKALETMHLKNGTTVNKGDWLCAPQAAIMRDPRHFPHPTTFNPNRFLEQRSQGKVDDVQDAGAIHALKTRFTDATPTWLIWGIGRAVCPGRFYADAIIKLILRSAASSGDRAWFRRIRSR